MTMHSRSSNQLVPMYTSARIAVQLKGLMRFRSPRSAGQRSFPATETIERSRRKGGPRSYPAAAIAVPVASPIGMAPAGLAANNASSSSDERFKSCRAERDMGAAASGSVRELQREIDQAGFAPPDFAEVELAGGIDEPDLVANFSREQRCLRVVEDDALFAVDPTRRVVDAGDNAMTPAT